MTDEKAIEKMVYDQQQGWPLCPRCGERMPDKLTHGALNGPWSNAACIGYCVMAMRNAGLSEKTQRKVLDELTRCFDDVSVEDAAQMKF